MQAIQPQGGSAEAITPRYDTIVIRGAQGRASPKEVDGGEVVAWSIGHGMAAMDALEEFVDDLAAGNCNQPQHLTQGAADALNLMRRRNVLGWEADEPDESPPADWKTAVSRAEATVRKVFEGCDDEAGEAIEYFAALMLARAPAEPSAPEEPFLFVYMHAGDVMDWTQDPSQADTWELEGHTVAKLYTARQHAPSAPEAKAYERNDERTLTSTLLVSASHFDAEVTPELIAGWSDAECQAVEDYCAAIHYAASDNDGVVIPQRPAVLGGAQ